MACLNAENKLGEQAPNGVLVYVLFLESMVLDQVVKIAALAELKRDAMSVYRSLPPNFGTCLHADPERIIPGSPFDDSDDVGMKTDCLLQIADGTEEKEKKTPDRISCCFSLRLERILTSPCGCRPFFDRIRWTA